jgi:hypothetical protein
MRSLTSLWGPPIAAAIDTANERCAVDVGGANGSLLHLLLEADPSLRGIVFGRSNVAEHAKAELVRKRLAERAGIAGGDLFKSVGR